MLRWPWDPAVNTRIARRSARRRSEGAVLKKGPFDAKLSRARQLFATTAMPCHQKHTLLSETMRLARGFLKKHSAAARTSARLRLPKKWQLGPLLHYPCQQKPKKKHGATARAHRLGEPFARDCRIEDNFLRTGPTL